MHVHCVPPQIRPDTRSPTKWHGRRPSGHTLCSLALVRGRGVVSARKTASGPHPSYICKVSHVDNLYETNMVSAYAARALPDAFKLTRLLPRALRHERLAPIRARRIHVNWIDTR